MKYFKDTQFDFGQYIGLTLQEVYQGSVAIDGIFIEKYLDEILNQRNNTLKLFDELDLIENFEISQSKIQINGEIFDCEEPYSKSNSVHFGNIQSKLEAFINNHFNANMSGALFSVKAFNKKLDLVTRIGGDPEYIAWCIKNVEDFQVDKETLDFLQTLPIVKWQGFNLLYVGNETYEYHTKLNIEYFQFNQQTFQLIERNSNSIDIGGSNKNHQIGNLNYLSDDQTDWTHYNDDMDMDQQSEDFWNQF